MLRRTMVRPDRVFASLLAVALTASACGGGDDADAPASGEAADNGAGDGEVVELTMGSWRSDDVEQMETILAAFHEANPGVSVSFEPTLNTEYNASLRTSLESGTGPDLFYVRSFAGGRELYEEGFIEPLDDAGLEASFDEPALEPWSLDGTPYAIPMIAVSHGFYYNTDLFDQVGVEIPTTWDELLAAAEALQAEGITPIANASGDEWTMAEMLFMNFAPSFIGGREGRLAYEAGERCFDDDAMTGVFQAMADLAPYLPEGQEALTYADSQQLWLLQEAAMWIGGSWDIPYFEGEEPDFEWNVFPVPTPDGGVDGVSFHLDAGIGVNAAGDNVEVARTVIDWFATDEAASLIASELPGFFPVKNDPPEIENPIANEFLSWNADREADVRLSWPVLSDGSPDAYALIQDGAVGVVNGSMTPEDAAADLQAGLAEWYEPTQGCVS